VVCYSSAGDCPPLCAQCGTAMLFGYSHADKNIYDRQCLCPRPERPEYEPSVDDVARMRRWFADNSAPVGEEFARFALTSVAEVADGIVTSTSFEDRDGAVAAVTPDIARQIVTRGLKTGLASAAGIARARITKGSAGGTVLPCAQRAGAFPRPRSPLLRPPGRVLGGHAQRAVRTSSGSCPP
jgi:hypothetical protein